MALLGDDMESFSSYGNDLVTRLLSKDSHGNASMRV
jgi:hypothetical protein